mmetsp:Transcript_35501/g.93748  ORF Transcript_35501/g.93748 Transcript_35501/m.93748 type:complete len:281 (+) Transcript_35501:77-919(+)
MQEHHRSEGDEIIPPLQEEINRLDRWVSTINEAIYHMQTTTPEVQARAQALQEENEMRETELLRGASASQGHFLRQVVDAAPPGDMTQELQPAEVRSLHYMHDLLQGVAVEHAHQQSSASSMGTPIARAAAWSLYRTLRAMEAENLRMLHQLESQNLASVQVFLERQVRWLQQSSQLLDMALVRGVAPPRPPPPQPPPWAWQAPVQRLEVEPATLPTRASDVPHSRRVAADARWSQPFGQDVAGWSQSSGPSEERVPHVPKAFRRVPPQDRPPSYQTWHF